MGDLFSSSRELKRLEVPDAEIQYLEEASLPASPAELLDELIADTPWRQEEISVWGKRHLQPRLIAWYGDNGRSYIYSGIRLEPLPWSNVLTGVREAVEKVSDEDFNSVLLNYYRDHRDSMGFHSDDEPELGPEPVIASVSLGEQRTFVLKHKTRTDLKAVRLELASGSVLIMRGATQRHWKHGIEKQSRPCGPRVNLTFRKILFPRAGT